MPKILVRKEKKRFVKELGREVIISKPLRYYVKNTDQDVQTRLGIIPKTELKKKPGSIVKTKTGQEFVLLEAGFADQFKHIKRLPQTIPLKDMGIILAETGVNKNSTVIDCGTGSGALACFLALHCKKVITYDVREDHLEIAKQNAKTLGIKNITFKNKDVNKGITEKNNDLITLDVPEPWKALNHVIKALKIGGFAVAYTIHASQLQEFVNTAKARDDVLWEKSFELIQRQWKVDGRMLRPENIPVGHSAFLTIIRRIR